MASSTTKPSDKQSEKWLTKLLESKDIQAAIASSIFVALGFVIVLGATKIIGTDSDLVVVSLLLLPVIMYSICSGRLEQVKMGELEAKFQSFKDQAKDSIESDVDKNSKPVDINQVSTLVLDGTSGSKDRRDHTKNVILTVTLGGNYKVDSCKDHIKYLLSQHINFKYIVFLDGIGEVVASTTVKAILQLLESCKADDFVNAINENKRDELLMCPGVVKARVSIDENNLAALETMVRKNLDAIVVVDKDNMLAGVVEQSHITSKLLLELAK